MRLFAVIAVLAVTLPAPAAFAEEATAPAAPAAEAAKPKKICRIKRAATGSNRRDGRVCKTEEQWRVVDSAEADYDRVNGGTPVRSSSNGSNDD
jgi:hypothetical protein